MPNLNIILNKIRENKTPLKVNLPQSKYKLDEFDICALAKALEKNTTVTSLNLSGHIFTIAAVRSLGKAIETHPSIKTLDFSDCKFGMMYSILKALTKNQTLQNISFSGGSFASVVITMLFDRIKESPSIRRVDISGHSLTSDEANEIIRSLQSDKCCITEFYCDGLDSLPQVIESLEKNKERLEKEEKLVPMDAIEENPEVNEVIEEGMFGEALDIHGMFGEGVSRTSISSAPLLDEEVKAEKVRESTA